MTFENGKCVRILNDAAGQRTERCAVESAALGIGKCVRTWNDAAGQTCVIAKPL